MWAWKTQLKEAESFQPADTSAKKEKNNAAITFKKNTTSWSIQIQDITMKEGYTFPTVTQNHTSKWVLFTFKQVSEDPLGIYFPKYLWSSFFEKKKF